MDFAPPGPRLRSLPREPGKSEDVIIGRNVKKLQKMRERSKNRSAKHDRPVVYQINEDYRAKERERLAQLGEKLSSHEPFIGLLRTSFKRLWPENDKEVDKEPP